MCYDHFATYGACSHGIHSIITCQFKRANPLLNCQLCETSGEFHQFEFCPQEACQKKNKEIEAANKEDTLKKNKSLRHRVNRKLSLSGLGLGLRRRSTPRYCPSEVSIPELPASSTSSELLGLSHTFPAVVERQSFPVMKKRRDQEPFVGDFEKSYSAPVRASSATISHAWRDESSTATAILHGTTLAKNAIDDRLQRGSLASTGSEIHAQTYRDLIGNGPYGIEEEIALPTTPIVFKEHGWITPPTRQASYKKPPSPPGKFRRVPSQSNTPRGSPPSEKFDSGFSQSSRPQASTPFTSTPRPKRVSSLPKKDPQLYHGQPTDRDIIITNSGRLISSTQSQGKLAPRTLLSRLAPPRKPKEDDRMSILTTMSDFLTDPLPSNFESRREGSKLADGSYDHRRLQQERQRNILMKPRPGTGNGKKVSPMLRLLAAKRVGELEAGNTEMHRVKLNEKRPASVATEWPPEFTQIQEESEVPQAKRRSQAQNSREQGEGRASGERKRKDAEWATVDESYLESYAKQVGISQEVSPSFPYQALGKSSPINSLDYQSSSPPTLETSKYSSFPQKTSFHEYLETQGRKRRSKNLFLPKTDTAHQAPVPKNNPLDDQIETQIRGRRSPQSSSPPRTNSSKQSSFPKRTSPDSEANVKRGSKRSLQKSSPPREESKHNSFTQQIDTQRRRHSPQNPSPLRIDLWKQTSKVSLNQHVTSHKRGKHSPQTTSPTRKDSSNQTSMTQSQDYYKDSSKNRGQDSYLIRQAGSLGCSTAEAEQERIRKTAEKEMQEKREEERRARVEREEAERIAGMQRLKLEERARKAAVDKEKRELEEARMQVVTERKKVEEVAKQKADEVEALRQADLLAGRRRDKRPGYSMPWPPKRHPDDKGWPYTMDHDGKPL